MDQRLRLTAEVRDNASPKLKAIGKELKAINRTPGMEQATKWFRGFNETANEFVKGGGGVAGVMGTIGLGGLTAAASLVGLIKAFKDLGDHTFAIKRLGQETGMTVDQIRKWETVGQVFRVPVDAIDGALKTFGDKMLDFKRRRGEIFGQLSDQDPGEVQKLLGINNASDQFKEVLRYIGTIKDAALQNRWASVFFGTDEVNHLLQNGLPDLEKAIADANKAVDPLPKDFQEKSDKLNASIVSFDRSLDNLKVNLGPGVFGALKGAADDLLGDFQAIETIVRWLKNEKAESVGGYVKDAARAAGAAINETLKEKSDANEAATAQGKGPYFNLPGALYRLNQNGKLEYGQDGNALHRNDEMPAGFHRSAYVTGFGGSDEGIAGGVKEGVLAAFRELMAMNSVDKKNAGVPGVVNASFETWDNTGGRTHGGRGGGGSGGGGADTPDGTGKDVPGAMRARGLDAMRYLVEKKGWTPEGAAIAVGNAQQESGIRGDGPAGDGGISQHMFQWNHERLRALNGFAAARGKAATDFQTNLDFMDEERKHRTAMERDWDKQHDLRNAGRLSHDYEGFGDNSGATREQNARNWLKAYKSLPSLTEEASKASAAGAAGGGIDAHIHLHQDGRVRGVTARSSGVVNRPRVNLRRGETMTEPSIEA